MGKNGLPSCADLFFFRDGKACWVYKIGVSVPSLEEGAAIDKNFLWFLKLSEMILDLKYIYLKFISFVFIAREIISKLQFDLPITYKLLDKSLFYPFEINFVASSTVQVVKTVKLS